MGASAWIYFVPYQDDVQAALEALREAVFRRGEYYTLPRDLDAPLPNLEEYRALFGEDAEDLLEQEREDRAFFRELQPLDSIEKLLDWNAEAGTHSILDVERAALFPEHSAVYPLTAEQQRELFGTEQPTRADVQAHEHELDRVIPARWTGAYFAVYEGDTPREWCFFGVSGD